MSSAVGPTIPGLLLADSKFGNLEGQNGQSDQI
jgi:hypothetical protein